MSGKSVAKRRCLAMIEAGIYDPESQKGIDFCVDYCPYDICVVFEYDGRGRSSDRKRFRIATAKKMYAIGVSAEDIAKELLISVRSIHRYLEK